LQPALSRRTAVIGVRDTLTLLLRRGCLQTSSSMRASMALPRDPAVCTPGPVTHGRTASPSIEYGSMPGRHCTSRCASMTNASYQYPLCDQLAMLDIGTVIAGRPSDRGPRPAVATATLTFSGHCAACCTFQIHRYGVSVSALHVGYAREWRCESACGTKT
jgi:hypothetical protein